MQFDPNRRNPVLVRCTERRYHPDRCRFRLEDMQDWLTMPNMDHFRCDFEFVPTSDGTYTGLMEGRDD